MYRSRAKSSTYEQRREWLRLRPELWKGYKLVVLIPGFQYRIFVPRLRHVRIVSEMKKAGLIAPTTYYRDVNVSKMVRALRGLR